MDTKQSSTLLIYSAPKNVVRDCWAAYFPIGLGYIQAMLKGNGYSCLLANFTGMGKTKIEDYLRRKKPQVVGISMFTFNRSQCYEIAKAARKALPEAIILAGGPHPTHLSADVLKECRAFDAIVCGEGETPMLEIVKRLAKGDNWQEAPSLVLRGRKKTEMTEPIANLDSIGIPAEHFKADFLDNPNEISYLSTSRGCPGKCSFCSTPEYWGSKVRFRSTDSIMKELKLLRKKYGMSYFNFRDDTFTTNKQRVLDICSAMSNSGLYPLWSCQSRVNLVDEERLVAMVRAGCEFIQFGVEHGSEPMLKYLNKEANMEQTYKALALARKVGMYLGIYLITGIPGETMEDVAKSEELINKALPHDVQLSPLAVYPGTRLFEEMLASGHLPKVYSDKKYDYELFARWTDEAIFKPVAKGSRLMKIANLGDYSSSMSMYDEHTTDALERLNRATEAIKPKARYTPEEFKAQKKFLGWCATTNLLCGEAAEDTGNVGEAIAEYSEVIKKEPQNPWGWMKRGFLYTKAENFTPAKADLDEAIKLIPKNYEITDALEYIAYSTKGRKQ